MSLAPIVPQFRLSFSHLAPQPDPQVVHCGSPLRRCIARPHSVRMARDMWPSIILATLSLTSSAAQSGREERVEGLLSESIRLSDQGRYLEAQPLARAA